MAITFEFFEGESLRELRQQLNKYISDFEIGRYDIIKIYNHSIVWDGTLLNKVMLVYDDEPKEKEKEYGEKLYVNPDHPDREEYLSTENIKG